MATTPFLGCKISLISKSEIRYEGILYTIDPKESTIALAKVRSYGTEDRTAERQVPPRDEIFEYIIFRAGDIKDLIVDDPPASAMPGPGLADPAIIQAHSTSTSSAATFPSSTFPQMTSGISTTSGQRSTGPPFGSGTTSGNSVIRDLTQPKTARSNDSRSGNSTPVPQRQKSPTQDWSETGHGRQVPNKENQQRRGGGGERGGHQIRRGGGPPSHNNQNYMGFNKRGSGPPNQGFSQGYRQGYSHGQNQGYSHGQNQGYSHGQNQPQSGNRFGGSANYNRQFNSYQGGGRRPQSRPQTQRGSQNRIQSNRPPKEPLKFDEDFDFDKANEDFKEIEEKMSNLKVDGQSAETPDDNEKANDQKVVELATNGDKEGSEKDDHFYDKTKSFFDSISCEAIEREKGNVQRIDWKAERKLNSETFGVPGGIRRYGYGYGYGRGRGYGHRGYSNYRPFRGGYGGRGGGGGGGDGRRFNGPAHNRT